MSEKGKPGVRARSDRSSASTPQRVRQNRWDQRIEAARAKREKILAEKAAQSTQPTQLGLREPEDLPPIEEGPGRELPDILARAAAASSEVAQKGPTRTQRPADHSKPRVLAADSADVPSKPANTSPVPPVTRLPDRPEVAPPDKSEVAVADEREELAPRPAAPVSGLDARPAASEKRGSGLPLVAGFAAGAAIAMAFYFVATNRDSVSVDDVAAVGPAPDVVATDRLAEQTAQSLAVDEASATPQETGAVLSQVTVLTDGPDQPVASPESDQAPSVARVGTSGNARTTAAADPAIRYVRSYFEEGLPPAVAASAIPVPVVGDISAVLNSAEIDDPRVSTEFAAISPVPTRDAPRMPTIEVLRSFDGAGPSLDVSELARAPAQILRVRAMDISQNTQPPAAPRTNGPTLFSAWNPDFPVARSAVDKPQAVAASLTGMDAMLFDVRFDQPKGPALASDAHATAVPAALTFAPEAFDTGLPEPGRWSEPPAALESRPPVAELPRVDAIVVHLLYPRGADEDQVAEARTTLEETGYTLRQPAPVGISIRQAQIRYYHPEDEAGADLLGERLGIRVRDFTNFTPEPDEGTVEVWLDGEASVARAEPVRQEPVVRVAPQPPQPQGYCYRGDPNDPNSIRVPIIDGRCQWN